MPGSTSSWRTGSRLLGVTLVRLLRLPKVACGAFDPLTRGVTLVRLLRLPKVACGAFDPLTRGVTLVRLLRLPKVACGAFDPLTRGVTLVRSGTRRTAPNPLPARSSRGSMDF